MKGLRVRLGNEKGTAIALVALSMVALISAIALAVDVGMLVTARTEAQRVADLSALAGAAILLKNPNDETTARSEAIKFAAFNTVQGDVTVVLPGDVAVDLDSSTVTVQVMRTQTRGTPVGTFFARVFGVNSVDITAVATAIAEPVGPDFTTECLLPIMLPDRWAEGGSPGSYSYPGIDDSFDPETDPLSKDFDDDGEYDTYYSPYPTGDPPPYPAGDPVVTGYNDSMIGKKMDIHKAGGGGGGMTNDWYFPWTPLDAEDQLADGGPGGAEYLSRFTTCMVGGYGVGDYVLTEPGAMVGPTNFGFDDVFNTDPLTYWKGDETGCPWNDAIENPDGTFGACYYDSPRVKPMPMFDPTQAPDNGRKAVQLTNFGSVFILEPQPGNNFSAIWLGLSVNGNSSSDPVEGLPKYIHLIK